MTQIAQRDAHLEVFCSKVLLSDLQAVLHHAPPVLPASGSLRAYNIAKSVQRPGHFEVLWTVGSVLATLALDRSAAQKPPGYAPAVLFVFENLSDLASPKLLLGYSATPRPSG